MKDSVDAHTRTEIHACHKGNLGLHGDRERIVNNNLELWIGFMLAPAVNSRDKQTVPRARRMSDEASLTTIVVSRAGLEPAAAH
jgi:hypothetical protein